MPVRYKMRDTRAHYLRGTCFSETLLGHDSPEIGWQMIGAVTVAKKAMSKKREAGSFGKDKRRKHHHFLVTVFYADGERFGRVYTDKDKATRFAERQRRSPVVKSARITLVS